MGTRTRLALCIVATLAVLSPLLVGCGATPTPTPTIVPTKAATAVPPTQAPAATKAPTSAPTAVPATATAVPPTPTKGPAVGGTLVYLHTAEPDTLDAGVTPGGSYCYYIIDLLGSTLVIKDPAGKYVGYLAESWKVSDDGLTWEFKLRKGVTFHDGTPLTAAVYAWTFTRAKDPATKSAAAGPNLGQIDKAEAVDDLTLRLKLKMPYFPMLENMTLAFLQPLSKAAVEKSGAQYGRNPVGVGPYKFKEWKTGAKVVIERNPDFTWAPAFLHQGPAYIQTIEFRIITEGSTQVAGTEAGEIDINPAVDPKDVPRFKDTSKYATYQALEKGIRPYVSLNVSKPPFDDIRVRKAFNLAVDRQKLIDVVAVGAGRIQYGPISPTSAGYWPGVEKIGYGYDLAQAKALMKEAGYTEGAGGVLQKDGKPFHLILNVYTRDWDIKVAEVLQQQYKALGVDVELQQLEFGLGVKAVFGGTYTAMVFGMGHPEADLMYQMNHSSQIGAMNCPQIKDPELDKILEQTRSLIDPVKRQEACDAAQKWMVEHAIDVPLYTRITYQVVNARIKGEIWSEKTATLYLHDAYIETK